MEKTPRREGKLRVYIVDDHPILREGVAQVINLQQDLEVCGETDNAAQALSEVPACKPDLLLVDISLKGTNGIELIKQLKVLLPELRIVILSVYDEELYAERGLRAGARGYVMKQAPTNEVLCAVRKVAQGGRYLSPNLQDWLLEHMSGGSNATKQGMDVLSDRELEVFQLIGKGLGTRDIAGQLRVSVKTIETHRAHLKEKLKLRTGIDLIRVAVEAENDAQWTRTDNQSRK